MATRERPPAGTSEATQLIEPPPPAQGLPPEPPPDRELWPWLLVLGLLVLAGLAAIWYATRDNGSPASAPETRLTTVAAVPAKPKPKKQPTTTAVAQVAVPDLVGQKRDDAVGTLEAAGLTASVNEVPSAQDKDIVVAQSPSGDEQVDKGSSVTLNVSKGEEKPVEPATVSVPDVVGQSSHDAGAAIRAAGLRPSTQHVPSTQAKDTIVSQSPGGGESAQKGAGVLLNVSEGPPKAEQTKPAKPSKSQQAATATVPDVTGESEEGATSDLQAAGFKVSSVDQPTDDPSMDGVVIDQSPSGGSDADPNTRVTIYVGRYSTG